jgi:hypothetical protein
MKNKSCVLLMLVTFYSGILQTSEQLQQGSCKSSVTREQIKSLRPTRCSRGFLGSQPAPKQNSKIFQALGSVSLSFGSEVKK